MFNNVMYFKSTFKLLVDKYVLSSRLTRKSGCHEDVPKEKLLVQGIYGKTAAGLIMEA